jgi:DNA-binding MarR family transcriptional regulator
MVQTMPQTMPKSLKAGTRGAVVGAGDELQSLGYLVRYAHRALVKALADQLEPHGLLTTQWSVLRILWDIEGLTQVELADRMRVEKASLTGVLDSMERAGLIKRIRNDDDRRKINITLTTQGRHLKADVLPYATMIGRKATRGMSGAETAQLRRLLTKLVQNLDA